MKPNKGVCLLQQNGFLSVEWAVRAGLSIFGIEDSTRRFVSEHSEILRVWEHYIEGLYSALKTDQFQLTWGDILFQNGSAVDAAIAVMFCSSLVNCQSTGLGGGLLMTIYEKNTKKIYSLDAREVAPSAVTEEMFSTNSKKAQIGPLSIAVPGELAGYHAAHKRFGRLNWSKLVEPTLKICKEGFNISQHQYDALVFQSERVRGDEVLAQLFVNPSTRKFYRPGTKILHHKYCETLEIIARNGGNVLYNGSLAEMLAQDVQEAGGIITLKDLNNYRVHWDEPVSAKIKGGFTLYTSPFSGSGLLLTFIFNILNSYNFTKNHVSTISSTILTYHRIVEAFKFAFAKRMELGDPSFIDVAELVKNLTSSSYGEEIRERINDDLTFNEGEHYGGVFYGSRDHGTAHLSIVSKDGDVASVTSSINSYFGAGVTSKSSGIFLNNAMDDFSFPYFSNVYDVVGSSANKVEPNKRPLSSMCPSIVLGHDNDIELVIGAAGGTKIITSVAFVIMKYLWFGEDIKQAIDSSRIHHQLFPMELGYEYGLLQQIVGGLEKRGHKMSRFRGRSVVGAIAKSSGKLFSNADYRKGGEVYGI